MKKKIALLLVLAMVVSLIPMNVFGRTRLDLPDREINDLPATITTTLELDLADLDEDARINGDWSWDNEFSDEEVFGYPLTISLDEDAVFGADLDTNGGSFHSNTLFSEDWRGTLTEDADDVLNAIIFANAKAGLWTDAGPAFAVSYDTNSHEADASEVGTLAAPAVVKLLAASTPAGIGDPDKPAKLPGGGDVIDFTATGWYQDFKTGFAEGHSLGATPAAAKTATEPKASLTDKPKKTAGQTDADYAADLAAWVDGKVTNEGNARADKNFSWETFAAFFAGESPFYEDYAEPATKEYTVTWIPVELNSDNNELTILVMIVDQETDELVQIPDFDAGEVYVNINLPIVLSADDWAAKLTVTDGTSDAEIYSKALISGSEPWVEVQTGEIASFTSTGFLDEVTLSETLGGFLNGDADTQYGLQMRLTSDYAFLMENPRDRLTFSDKEDSFHNETDDDSSDAYRILGEWGKDDEFDDIEWAFDYEVGTRRIANSINNADYTDEFDLMFTFPSNDVYENPDDYTDNDFARYDISNIDKADDLILKNLMASFDERQVYGEEIGIEYRLVSRAVNYDADGDFDDFDDWSDDDSDYDDDTLTYVDDDHDDWEDASGTVLVRGADEMSATIIDERGFNGVDITTLNTVVSGQYVDQETSIFRIKEASVGTWNNGPLTMTVPAGVEIVGAHVGLYEYPFDAYAVEDREDNGERVGGTVNNDSGNDGNIDNWTEDEQDGSGEYRTIQRHQDYYNNDGIRINNNSIIIDPMQTYLTDSGERREIEVQLEVSVQAGYVAKHDGTGSLPLEVTFSGSYAGAPLAIATIQDPITVTAPEIAHAPVDSALTYEHVIGDITVTETAAGNLEQNSEIWLYVVGANQLDLNLTASYEPTVNTAESGLQLYAGTQLRHSYGSFLLNGVRYNVQRSSGLTNYGAALGSITFNDVKISGTLAKGASYSIVISGNSIAANDYTVWTNDDAGYLSNPNSDDYATWAENRSNQAGIFDGELPYVISAVGWDETDVPTEAAPPTDVTPVTVVPVLGPQEFGPYSYTTDATGTYNTYYMAAASNGVGFAGISPRAFANYIGAETGFDDATQTATITGTDASGNAVVLQLTRNSTNAVINGQPVDIAQYNEHPGYPVGSIAPFNPGNGHIYLPVRFLCKAFQVDFTYNDLTKSVTLY